MPRRWSFIQRHLQGSLQEGLLEAELSLSFEIFEGAEDRVELPILDSAASLLSVRLDDHPSSLQKRDGLYRLGLKGPGLHRLKVKFLLGHAQERFERQIKLRLPAAGPTQLSLSIPELEIKALLKDGVIQTQEEWEGNTLLEAELGGAEWLQLSWKPEVIGTQEENLRWSLKQSSLFTVGASLISGLSHFKIEVEEGEMDRLQLRLPPGLEVLKVEGEQLLQWRSQDEGRLLMILLRGPNTKEVQLSLHFQLPVGAKGKALLKLPQAPEGISCRGTAGVQASTGLDLKLRRHHQAKMLDPLELPRELVEMSGSPLLFGFEHREAAPELELGIIHNRQLELTDSIIDELEASTVLLKDGSERSKFKLHMRNNTRQYLGLKLPEGAVLTQALVEGLPLRPAVESLPDGGERLLFPLQQSRRLSGDQERRHVVRPGETLGSIAYLYYSNPQRWQIILEHNNLYGEDDLQAGQVLEIPPLKGVEIEEVRFVVELAYERQLEPLGWLGRRGLALPELDVSVLKATWHLYLPEVLDPLSFESNLVQYSAIRYDPFRRIRDFMEQALLGGEAWAGGKYRSILSRRQKIYQEDQAQRAESAAPLATFPLVGERFRFKRLLLGKEIPQVEVYYLSDLGGQILRIFSLLSSLLLVLWALWPRRRLKFMLLALLPFAGLMVLGHFIIGLNRHLLWGLDLGLLLLLLLHGLKPLKAWVLGILKAPWLFLEWVQLSKLLSALLLLFLLSMGSELPLLTSLSAFLTLSLLWGRLRRSLRDV